MGNHCRNVETVKTQHDCCMLEKNKPLFLLHSIIASMLESSLTQCVCGLLSVGRKFCRLHNLDRFGELEVAKKKPLNY